MKIIDSTIVAKLKFVTLFAINYTDRKGTFKKWDMVSRKNQPKCITHDNRQPDAAIVIPYHSKEDKLVVIREYRVPVGDYIYEFPAGLIDPGEDPAFAACRELHEETGLNMVSMYRHSPAVYSSAGLTDEAVAMIFAEVTGTPSGKNNEDSEEIEIFLMDREEVRGLLQRKGAIFGAKAWMAMDAYVLMGKEYLTGRE